MKLHIYTSLILFLKSPLPISAVSLVHHNLKGLGLPHSRYESPPLDSGHNAVFLAVIPIVKSQELNVRSSDHASLRKRGGVQKFKAAIARGRQVFKSRLHREEDSTPDAARTQQTKQSDRISYVSEPRTGPLRAQDLEQIPAEQHDRAERFAEEAERRQEATRAKLKEPLLSNELVEKYHRDVEGFQRGPREEVRGRERPGDATDLIRRADERNRRKERRPRYRTLRFPKVEKGVGSGGVEKERIGMRDKTDLEGTKDFSDGDLSEGKRRDVDKPAEEPLEREIEVKAPIERPGEQKLPTTGSRLRPPRGTKLADGKPKKTVTFGTEEVYRETGPPRSVKEEPVRDSNHKSRRVASPVSEDQLHKIAAIIRGGQLLRLFDNPKHSKSRPEDDKFVFDYDHPLSAYRLWSKTIDQTDSKNQLRNPSNKEGLFWRIENNEIPDVETTSKSLGRTARSQSLANPGKGEIMSGWIMKKDNAMVISHATPGNDLTVRDGSTMIHLDPNDLLFPLVGANFRPPAKLEKITIPSVGGPLSSKGLIDAGKTIRAFHGKEKQVIEIDRYSQDVNMRDQFNHLFASDDIRYIGRMMMEHSEAFHKRMIVRFILKFYKDVETGEDRFDVDMRLGPGRPDAPFGGRADPQIESDYAKFEYL